MSVVGEVVKYLVVAGVAGCLAGGLAFASIYELYRRVIELEARLESLLEAS